MPVFPSPPAGNIEISIVAAAGAVPSLVGLIGSPLVAVQAAVTAALMNTCVHGKQPPSRVIHFVICAHLW
jgi:hypothetical protein